MNLMLDIKPLRDQRRNCFEDILASLAPFYSRDYELMFAEAWNFTFMPKAPNADKLLGERIEIKQSNDFLLLQKYHGIKFNTHKYNSLPEFLCIVNSELLSGHPLILSLPRYCCPWSPLYHKQLDKIRHSLIIIGIDKENEYLICTDPFYTKYKVQLPINDLEFDYLSLTTFDLLDINNTIDWHEIAENIVSQVRSKNNYFNNSFDAIRYFGNEISQITHLNREINDNSDSSLEKKIYGIDYSRRKVSLLFEYIGNQYNIDEFVLLSNKMMQVAGKWNAVYSLLLKAYYKSNTLPEQEAASILKRVSDIVKLIADNEEQISDTIIEIVHKNSTHICHDFALTTNMHNAIDDNQIEFLNLSDFFNNNCFGKEASTTCAADINGNRSYILNAGLPLEKIWQVDYMKFSFPEILETQKNNISCLGQIIHVPNGKYSKIMILGCAVMGNQIENIGLEFFDASTEEICLEFTDAWFPQPIFGEKSAWQGQYVTRIHNAVEIVPHKFSIYAQSYLLTHSKEIISIHLPHCPNIHIFSISLLKCNN